jgi:hypothetical protein
MNLGRPLPWLAALSLSLAAAGARAQMIEAEVPPAIRTPIWEVAAGVRTAYIKGAGYDPFSDDDGFVQFSICGTRVLVAQGERLAFAAGIGLDAGSSSSTARGTPSSLSLTRVSALAEGRYQPWHRVYGFARLAPGLLHGSASLSDPSAPNEARLTDGFNTFALDASAGAAVRLGEMTRAGLGIWLTADGGYG